MWPGLWWPCVVWLWAQGQTTTSIALGACVITQGLNLFAVSPLSIYPHKASPYSMDDRDPRKFFMSGERMWVTTKGLGVCPEGTD